MTLERLQSSLADRYTIGHEIGSGGMATVYLAEDLKHHRQVAIKVLKPELAASLGAERFLREIEIAASLTHPNILPLHDSGKADGLLYYVMPYVEGESLRDRLSREKQLSIEDALQITSEVADALGHAHSLGVVHRDVKPENILFEAGHAVVTDFGIAKAVTEAGGEALTETGLAIGTPAYMSPEQATGTKDVDSRSDVYSLGCVLYEMLAGDPPFTASTPQAIMAKKVYEPLPRISVVREAVPPDVEAALAKAMAKTPADRFATTARFSEQLAAVTAGGIAIGVGPTRRAGRRSRWLVPLAGAVALTVLAVGVWQLRGNGAPTAVEVSDTRLAVFPFRGSAADTPLSEDLALLLHYALDGAGEIRGVDPNALFPTVRRHGIRDLTLEEASVIAEEFGAGLFVLGRAVEVGGRLSVDCSLYESSGSTEPQASAFVEAASDSLGPLVDSLARGLVATLPLGSGMRLADISTAQTENYDALKAYLEGEQAMRVADYPVARAALGRAVALDSTFAQARFRWAVARAWSAGDMSGFEEVVPYRDDLSERDRLLLSAWTGRDYEEADRVLAQLLSRYPTDVEGLYLKGDLNVWHNWQRGRPMALALEPLERAIELDPGHQMSLLWLGVVYAVEGRFQEAVTALQHHAEGNTYFAGWVRNISAFTFGGPGAQERVIDELSRSSYREVGGSAGLVATLGGNLPGAMRIADLLTDSVARPDVESGALGYLHLAHLELARGRWRAANGELDNVEPVAPALALAHRSLLAVTPFLELEPSELRALRDSLVRWDGTFADAPSADTTGLLSPFHIPEELRLDFRTYLLGLVHARLGESSAALGFARELEQAATERDFLALLHDASLDIRATVALYRDDPATALDILERARLEFLGPAGGMRSRFVQRPYHRLLRAEVLYGLDRDEEALGWFGSFPGPGSGISLDYTNMAYTHLRRGQLYERLGDPEKAVDHYAKFLEMWADAEPELRPLVEQATERMAVLTGER